MRVLLSLTVFSALFVLAVARLAQDTALTEYRKVQAADRAREAEPAMAHNGGRVMTVSSASVKRNDAPQPASTRAFSICPW